MLNSVTSELAPEAVAEIPFNPPSLVDRTIIAEAEKRHSDLMERLDAAKAQEAGAKAAVVTAEKQRTAALIGDASPNVTIAVADDLHRESIRQHALACDAVVALERAVAHCRMVELPQAKRAANIPLARWCLSERLAAAREADAARALLAKADARTARANSCLQLSGVVQNSAVQALLYGLKPIEQPFRVTNNETEELALQAESDLSDIAA